MHWKETEQGTLQGKHYHDVRATALVSSDLCGKMRVNSVGGAEYFLTFLDHHTHYCWVGVSSQEEGPNIQLFQGLES